MFSTINQEFTVVHVYTIVNNKLQWKEIKWYGIYSTVVCLNSRCIKHVSEILIRKHSTVNFCY